MKLSVSIPIYNAEKYLNHSISSVINQSFQDFELLLVDDGSTDSSIKICKIWAEKYPKKIRIIEKKHSGSLLTRKRCIEESKYEYIYIMDSDDYLITNDAFEKIFETIEKSGADLVFFDSMTDDKRVRTFPYENETVFENDSFKIFYDEFLKSDSLYSLWNKVFKKNLINFEIDYLDCEDIVYGTDLYQIIPIISRAQKIVYLKACFYNYRYKNNPNSIVHKFKKQSYITAKKNQMRLEKYAYTYKWNVDNLDKKLLQNKMRNISTAAYRIRLIKNSLRERQDYLKLIGDDDYFRKEFNLKGLPAKRSMLLILMYLRFYKLISLII